MTTTLDRSRTTHATALPAAFSARARRAVGGFYLVMGGINAGIVAADPETYRTFADGSFWPFVTRAWHDVVMAQPYLWFLLLAAGEVVLGLLLLRGGRAARVGWAGVVAFHVALMSFGFGFWLWCVPALGLLVPAAVADWPRLAAPRHSAPPVPPAPRAGLGTAPPDPRPRRRVAERTTTVALAVLVLASSAYGLLAAAPYRGLPEATVTGARAQDAVSVLVALLLLGLAARATTGTATRLLHLGLLGYLTYSYLIYVSGVPMNRVFLVYVAIVCLSGAGLASGIVDVVRHPPPSSATSRLRRWTGWLLLATAVLFAGLWLSMLVPYALGGSPTEPQGVGGTPYPVFWLDLGLALPAIGAVGVLLLRDRPAGPPLAVVALVKIVTLFTALWAGPLLAAATGREVHLGPDAVPSLLLLAAATWLVARWAVTLREPASPRTPAP